MKKVLFLSATILFTACGASTEPSAHLSAQNEEQTASYPIAPHTELTPGDLCKRPSEYRYPERIAYCSRSVGSGLKKMIIKEYDAKLNYRIGQMNRGEFKIDHFIPLCMGGSNERENLWPQHRTVYIHTDPIEQKLCQLMAYGELTQVKAIEIIKQVKFDLDKAAGVDSDLDAKIDEFKDNGR